MRICVGMDFRFDRTPDGLIWTRMAYQYEFFWSHYLNVFDEVRVIARLNDVYAVPPGSRRADGPNVTFAPVPFYLGPLQYTLKYWQIGRVIRENVGPEDAVLGRIPSQVSNHMLSMLEPGRPFGVHVVGNPYELFAPGALHHPLRPVIRWLFDSSQRRHCSKAAAAGYVTKAALQKRYPCAGHSVSFSDVQIPDDSFAAAPRDPPAGVGGERPVTLVTVGSLENRHKAVDVQIEAVAECRRAGLDVRLVVVGGGRLRPELEALARQRGVEREVEFRGQLPAGDAVRQVVRAADLFLLPSRTEGLPRAMIEAMSQAMPCIGSAVGGIPELLAPDDLVPPGDAAALARKIAEVAREPGRLRAMSARNLETSRDFGDTRLRERRYEFYSYVRRATEQWVARRRRGH